MSVQYLDRLNSEQSVVVEAASHCFAIYCLGSGKTSAVAAKVAFHLAQGYRGCAVPFTRLGALELRERIALLTGGKHRERLLTYRKIAGRSLFDCPEVQVYQASFVP